MDLHGLRYAVLKIALATLVVSSWVFVSFIFQTRPEQDGQQAPLSKLVRLPASLPLRKVFEPPVKAQEPVRMDVVDLPCWDKTIQPPTSQKSLGRWIRITGKACSADEESVESVMVSNDSNGYMATVFSAQSGVMTTDFIPLETGKNEIRIRFVQPSGAAIENRFTFLR